MNVLKKILLFIGKIFGYGIIFCVVVFGVMSFGIIQSQNRAKAIRAEICDQAIVGQKLEFKSLIEKYNQNKEIRITFKKENEKTELLIKKALDAESLAYLTDMTGHFSFTKMAAFSTFNCLIYVKKGIVERKALTGLN